MGPMLGRKVIEGKEDFFIFLQAFAGLRKFGLVTGDELSRKLPEPLCGSAPGTFQSISCLAADGQLRRAGKSQAFELPKQFTPGLSAFPVTIDNG